MDSFIDAMRRLCMHPTAYCDEKECQYLFDHSTSKKPTLVGGEIICLGFKTQYDYPKHGSDQEFILISSFACLIKITYCPSADDDDAWDLTETLVDFPISSTHIRLLKFIFGICDPETTELSQFGYSTGSERILPILLELKELS